jgi:4-aminobutyrate aminotransferase / (S)-3-amino-2-methylpropionate transaminase / 5-aminovalerate transaminase
MQNPELTEQELRDLESHYCSYGDTVHYSHHPIIFEHCEGVWLYDLKGKPYLDMQMWYSAVNFGYKNKEIENAHTIQMERLPQLASQYLHKEKILLAAAIAQETEKRLGEKGRVHFNVGGAQAIEDSLKLVRMNQKGKSLMIAFMGGYHGRTLAATEITSSYRYRKKYGHFGNRALFIPFPYCYRCIYDKKYPSCEYYCADQFKKLFETEYYGVVDKEREAEFAAFYVEPVQATGGYIVPPLEYFMRIMEVLKQHRILLVDDEIQMGFYRTGKLWTIENFGIKPDIIAFAKSLTNGLNPLSGIWAREGLISPTVFQPGSTHSTFSSNPLGTAAGLATMELIKKNDFSTIVQEKGAYLVSALKDLQKKYSVIGDIDGLGLAVRIEMTKADRFTPDRDLTDSMFQEGLKGGLVVNGKEYGVILDVGGYYKNVFTLAPALTISFEEMDLFITLFKQLLKKCVN